MWPTKLSEHLSGYEFSRTNHREYLEQQDNPSNLVIENAIRFAKNVFEPARALVGPLLISSGYRCYDLNSAVRGFKSSYHPKGLACDCFPLKMGLKKAFLAILNGNVPYDQLIYEFGKWIHLGGPIRFVNPRGQKFMVFEIGKYLPFDENDPRVK